MKSWAAFGAATALGLLHGPAPAWAQNVRAGTSAGPFQVFGDSAPLRLALARRAEELRKGWLESTGLSGETRWPIILDMLATSPTGRAAAVVRLFVGDAGAVKVQASLPPGLPAEETDLAVLRALALEHMHRDAAPRPGRAFSMPPSWLIEATWQEIHAREKGTPAALFAKLMESSPPPKLDAFLRQRPEFMKPTARAVYRAQALALLRALLMTAEGRQGLERYVSSLHRVRPDDPRALFAAFPSLENPPGQLAKLWTLSLARSGAVQQAEPLSADATRKRLEEILGGIRAPSDVKLPEGSPERGASLMSPLSHHPSGRKLLSDVVLKLQALEARAHPLWVPVVAEYRALAAELARKPRKDAVRRVGAVAELAQALAARMEAVADYLNWFEASQVQLPSGVFEEALPEAEAPRRTDRITAALDAFDRR